jgi:hypothetical protein
VFDEIDDQQFRQMDRSLRVFRSAAVQMQRPRQGWLRAIRDVLGIPAREVAETLKSSRQLPVGFEQAEAEDRITLKSLRRAADAIGFELVYALVPKVGTLGAVVEARGRAYPRKPPKVVNARRNRATG